MAYKPNQTEGNKELDRYERIVDRAHNEIEKVRAAYYLFAGIMGAILATAIACGTFLTYNTINDMRSDLDQRTEKLANEVNTRIEKEFGQEDIRELIANQARIRVDAIADELIGKHVENKIDPKIQEVDIKLKTLDDETAVLREEFASVTENQKQFIGNFTDKQVSISEEFNASFAKQKEQIKQLERSANAHAKMFEKIIQSANLPELLLSSHSIQKVEAGYEIKLTFNPSNDKHLSTIVFKAQIADVSVAKILDFSRLGISTNVKHTFEEDGKTARFQYSPMVSEIQQIKIQVSGACKLSISGNYLPEPVNIVVGKKSYIVKTYSESYKRLQDAMVVARYNGYLFTLTQDDNAITNYHVAHNWMHGDKPSLLTDDEISIIKRQVEKNFKQDLTTLTFNGLREIKLNQKLEYQFHIQHEITRLTLSEKLGIIAAYTNMLKNKYEGSF